MDALARQDGLGTGPGLPEAHEDQVSYGMQIVHNAYNGKVQAMLQELQGLRLSSEELKDQGDKLKVKNDRLEGELRDSQTKGNELAEENKDLFKTVQRLRKQLQRLDFLKNKVMDSLHAHHEDDFDEEPYGGLAAAPTYGGGVGRLPPSGGMAQSPMPVQQALPGPSPVATRYDSPSIAAEGGLDTAVDGKQFFRQARAVLSNDAFNTFLTSIKKLNSQQQTRDQTLAEAARIFGPQHANLAQEFERLLQRHTF
jgi:hypothetical protein